jgi:ABC-type branched-subunit amino acid transport system substrate-binding protein
LFVNPRSGGGKSARFRLADEARKRGIEPVELRPTDDLTTLVQSAANGGADGLAMAGGDGSQAIVAAIAAERGLATPAFPPGRATTSRSTSASTATTSLERSTRSLTGPSVLSTWPR